MRVKSMVTAACLLGLTVTAAGCAVPLEATSSPPAPSASVSASPGSEMSPGPDASPIAEAGERQAIMDFTMLLKTEGAEKAAFSELRRLLPILPSDKAADLFLAFESYQNAAVDGGTVIDGTLITLLKSSGLEGYSEKMLNELSAVEDVKLREALRELFDRGYKLIIPEGFYQATIDYDAYREFERYLPADYGAYIGIMASESEDRMAEDGGILIPLDAVLTRALACGSFLAAYPDSVKRDAVTALYGRYIDAYFFGLNNTPAFDYETHKLNQVFLDSYRNTSQGPAEDALMRARVEYLKVLQKNDYTLTPTVADYRRSLTNQLKNTITTSG